MVGCTAAGARIKEVEVRLLSCSLSQLGDESVWDVLRGFIGLNSLIIHLITLSQIIGFNLDV